MTSRGCVSWDGTLWTRLFEGKEACRKTMIETHTLLSKCEGTGFNLMVPHPRIGRVEKIGKDVKQTPASLAQGSAQICFTSFTSSQCGQKLQARPFGSPPSQFVHSFVVAKVPLPATSRRAGRVASTLLMRFLSLLHSPPIRSSFRSCVMSAQLSETDRRRVEDFLSRCDGGLRASWSSGEDLWYVGKTLRRSNALC